MSGTERIYCLRYLATPRPENAEALESGGAYVNCWIRADSESAAQRQAVKHIRDSGWLIEALEQSYPCTRQDFSGKKSSLSCFDEAYVEGASFVFHTWPPEPRDEDASGIAGLRKLTRHVGDSEVPLDWPRVFRREPTTGPDRLAIAARESAVDLMSDMASCLGPELYVLYVLVVPRGEEAAGRYQSPLLPLPDVRILLNEFTDLFEKDGRHHVWIGASDGSKMLVYDRHNILYAYGPLDGFEEVLGRHGYEQGEFSIAFSHTHYYHHEFDAEVRRLLARWDWHRTELREPDDY